MFVLVAAAGLAHPLSAQQGDGACSAVAELPPELAGWEQRRAVTAALSATGLDQAAIRPGQAVEARLSAAEAVRFRDVPTRAAQAGDHAGLLAMTVAEAGVYRVALGAGAWVDVLEAGVAVESTAHGHGPACSGIAKMVDFPLKAGAHILQIEGSKDAAIEILVVRLP